MSAALIGGGSILQSMGQQRALSAQMAEQDAAQGAVMRANEAAREKSMDMAANITQAIAAPDIGQLRQELAKQGITGGEAAQIIRQAQAQAVPGAMQQTGENISMDMANLGSEIGGIRSGLRLDLMGHEGRMRVAGMRGQMLRQMGQFAQIGGQAAMAQAANRPNTKISNTEAMAGQNASLQALRGKQPTADDRLNMVLQQAYDPADDLDMISRIQREGLQQ